MPDCKEFHAVTSYSSEGFILTWIIKNFSMAPSAVGACLSSRSFDCKGKRWFLHLYPNGMDATAKGKLSLFLTSEDLLSSYSTIRGECKLSIKDKNGADFHPRTVHVYNNGFQCPDFFCRETHLETCKPLLLPNNSLTIECRLTKFTYDGGSTEVIVRPKLNKSETVVDYGRLFKDLYLSAVFSDVVLKVDNEKIPSHKVILAAHSPVFKAMFSHNATKESMTGEVIITDTKATTLKNMLLYMYIGKIQGNDWEEVKELLIIADKYQLRKLVCICQDVLAENLVLARVCEFAVFAYSYDFYRLKMAVNDFINSNLSALVERNEWNVLALEKPDLIFEILGYNIKKEVE